MTVSRSTFVWSSYSASLVFTRLKSRYRPRMRLSMTLWVCYTSPSVSDLIRLLPIKSSAGSLIFLSMFQSGGIVASWVCSLLWFASGLSCFLSSTKARGPSYYLMIFRIVFAYLRLLLLRCKLYKERAYLRHLASLATTKSAKLVKERSKCTNAGLSSISDKVCARLVSLEVRKSLLDRLSHFSFNSWTFIRLIDIRKLWRLSALNSFYEISTYCSTFNLDATRSKWTSLKLLFTSVRCRIGTMKEERNGCQNW